MDEEDLEKLLLSQEEFEKLTPIQRGQHVNSLKIHKKILIDQANKIIKSLAQLGSETTLEITDQDDSITRVPHHTDENVHGFPQRINGPNYPQITDTTDFPKNRV